MRKIRIVLPALLILCLFAGCSRKSEETVEENQTAAAKTLEAAETEAKAEAESTESYTGKQYVSMEVKDYGTIILELDADTAPISASNFIELTNEGFYDGLTFHRIIDGFMIQGGDPLGNGTGGSMKNIKGEFAANGVDNSISHERGVISMARSNDPDSASSQFFIVHKDSPFLDGNYAGFGHVISGMEVVDAICEATPVLDGNGTVAPENQPVITKVKVISKEEALSK